MDPERIAALWGELMARLGYARFGAQGGDWGAIGHHVRSATGMPTHVAGIHLNMVVAFPPDRRTQAGVPQPRRRLA